mgnify:CR=1 FL=1
MCQFTSLLTEHFDSLLGSGVRKWSVQPWAFLMCVENLKMDNSLKWVHFI